MDRAYHYTSFENWRTIQQTGILKPQTPPFQSHCSSISERARAVASAPLYLVCLERSYDRRWVDAGLIERLTGIIGMDVELEVPVLGGGFVRDCKFYPNETTPFCTPKHRQYLESAVPLQEYNGNFSIPEVWLSQETPVDRLKAKALREEPRKMLLFPL